MIKTVFDQKLTKKIKKDQIYFPVTNRSSTFSSKTMERKWIKTEQMLEALKNDPDNEQEYCHLIGGILRSTHWLMYDSEKNLIGNSTNWNEYDWYTVEEFLEIYADNWWRRDA